MEAGIHGRFEGQTRASAPTIKSNAQFLHIVFLAFSDGFSYLCSADNIIIWPYDESTADMV